MHSPQPELIPVGISQCLIGDPVRFNAGHKHSTLCTGDLGRLFQLVPFCPEMAIGLGTPRQTLRLVGDPQAPEVRGSRNPELEVTEPLQAYGREVAAQNSQLCGFIVMQKSPSCGMERVKVYGDNGYPVPGGGRGAFTASLMRSNPLLPVEEEGRLHDPVLRENFVTRVIVYHRWQQLCQSGLSAAALLDFHSRHKYLLLAHHQSAYRELGRLLAKLDNSCLDSLGQRYFSQLMQALAKPAHRGSHGNVLMHMAGYFRKQLSQPERSELVRIIKHYREGHLPLVVPITLLQHHLLRFPQPYLAGQVYLQPHPLEMSLRNAL